MSRQFIRDFDKAVKSTAPGSAGIAILNVLTVAGCIIAAPFTIGTSLFGLLAIPIYSALGSIANETYRTRLLVEMQVKITAEKEGLFEIPPPRRRAINSEFYEEEDWEDYSEQLGPTPEEEVFEEKNSELTQNIDSLDQSYNKDNEQQKDKNDNE